MKERYCGYIGREGENKEMWSNIQSCRMKNYKYLILITLTAKIIM